MQTQNAYFNKSVTCNIYVCVAGNIGKIGGFFRTEFFPDNVQNKKKMVLWFEYLAYQNQPKHVANCGMFLEIQLIFTGNIWLLHMCIIYTSRITNGDIRGHFFVRT